MSLNPFAALEKVINEHGSAVILKERLELAADQYAALERKVAELEIKAEQLEVENQTLRAQRQQHVTHIHALEVAAQNKRTGDRPDIEQRILVFLASAHEPDVRDIARQFGIGEQVVRFHLSELRDVEFVYYQAYIDREGDWHLAQEGRRYLIQRSLIQ